MIVGHHFVPLTLPTTACHLPTTQTNPVYHREDTRTQQDTRDQTKMAPAIKTKKVEVEKDEESGVMKTEVRSVEYPHLDFLFLNCVIFQEETESL